MVEVGDVFRLQLNLFLKVTLPKFYYFEVGPATSEVTVIEE